MKGFDKNFDKSKQQPKTTTDKTTINTPQQGGRPVDAHRINQGSHQTGGAGRGDLSHLNKNKTDKR